MIKWIIRLFVIAVSVLAGALAALLYVADALEFVANQIELKATCDHLLDTNTYRILYVHHAHSDEWVVEVINRTESIVNVRSDTLSGACEAAEREVRSWHFDKMEAEIENVLKNL